MLNALKFVQGAVAKDEIVSALTHVEIKGGRIRSYNGVMSLSSPIPLDLDCKPKAIQFIKAVEQCKDTTTLSITSAGRLRIVSGKFRSFIDCVSDDIPEVFPDGQQVQFDGADIIGAFKALLPFVGNDASRPWSNGILLDGASAFATNNILLVEHWLGSAFPVKVCIPTAAIKEIIRIGENPVSAQFTDTSATFHYEGERWLRTQLLSTEWPDLARILNREHEAKPFPGEFFKGLETIGPFRNKLEHIYLSEGAISTEAQLDEGACYELEEFPFKGLYQYKFLMLLKGIADTIDFGAYPAPCMFFGEKMRGAIVGLRGA